MEALIIYLCAYLCWVVMKYISRAQSLAVKSPFEELQNPATDELRALYREIDHDLGITDLDLLTPEKVTLPDSPQDDKNVMWVNLLWSASKEPITQFCEMPWPRQPVQIRPTAQGYDIVSRVEFPRWESGNGFVTCGVFLTDDKKHLPVLQTVGSVRAVMKGDIIYLNVAVPQDSQHVKWEDQIEKMRQLQKLKTRPGAGWLHPPH